MSGEKKKIRHGNWQVEAGKGNFVVHKDFIASINNPRYMDDPAYKEKRTFTRQYSLFGYSIYIERLFIPYVIKIYIPLLLLIITAYTSFFIHPNEFEANIEVGLTAFLSSIAFHTAQSQNLPKLGYLIKADMFFISTYMLIFFTIIMTVVSNYYYHKDQIKRAEQVDSVGVYAFPVIFAIILLISLYLR
jgi:hypothetical protein